MFNEISIDPFEFCRTLGRYKISFCLADLDSRVYTDGCFASLDATLEVEISGRIEADVHYVTVCLTGQCPLVCQRCLNEMPYTFNDEVQLVLCRHEDEVDQLYENEEFDAEAIVVGDTVQIREWIEDSILMAMPIVPMHENCEGIAYRQEYTNAFAVLKNLSE